MHPCHPPWPRVSSLRISETSPGKAAFTVRPRHAMAGGSMPVASAGAAHRGGAEAADAPEAWRLRGPCLSWPTMAYEHGTLWAMMAFIFRV